MVRCLPDGRWFDESRQTWRDRRGRPARWPDLIEAGYFRLTRVVLAAAHLDNNPANSRFANLRSLCQRCHLLHDLPFHRVQRWLTFRRRRAVGDLFLGLYEMQMSLPLFSKPGQMLAGMMIRSVPRDSWTSAQMPIAASTVCKPIVPRSFYVGDNWSVTPARPFLALPSPQSSQLRTLSSACVPRPH